MPEDSDNSTAEWYRSNFAEYADRTRSFSMFPGLLSDLDDFLARVTPGGTILDLGSGAGRDCEHISGDGFQVVALDVSRELLATCLTRVPASATEPIGVLADLRRLPFKKGAFAGIWACASVLHLRRSEISECISTCAQLLAPGGWIGVSMKDGRGETRRDGRLFTYLTSSELRGELEASGLVVEGIRGPDRSSWILGIARRQGQLSARP